MLKWVTPFTFAHIFFIFGLAVDMYPYKSIQFWVLWGWTLANCYTSLFAKELRVHWDWFVDSLQVI